MKTLAFLQNMWVRDPGRVKHTIAQDGEGFRRRFLTYALFAGCLTGRRLKAAFGDLCDDIVWEEVSCEIGGKSSSVFPPDYAHITQRMAEEKPDVLLAFGKIACDALVFVAAPRPVPVISGPHPAARHSTVAAELSEMANKLREQFLCLPK